MARASVSLLMPNQLIFAVSERRSTPRGKDAEDLLPANIVALARQYGRYRYRRITALLRVAGWIINARRLERIWRREGLKVPATQPKRGRLWLDERLPRLGIHELAQTLTRRAAGPAQKPRSGFRL